jgi:hypothetical protein
MLRIGEELDKRRWRAAYREWVNCSYFVFVQPYAKRALRVPKTGREIQIRDIAFNGDNFSLGTLKSGFAALIHK